MSERAAAKPTAQEGGWTVDDFRSYVATDHAPSMRTGGLHRLRAAIPASVKPNLRAAATRALRPLAQRQVAKATANGEPIRLHLGCGFTHLDGWVNVDLLGAKADVFWDLSRGLPFADESADAVFHEHVYEHLDIRIGYELARESHRVLRPGGVIRIGVPDAGALLDSYAGHASPQWAHSSPTPMLAVQTLFYEHGHLTMYDGETLKLLCLAAGFVDAEVSGFGQGRVQPSPDSEDRRDGTLYVEATRP